MNVMTVMNVMNDIAELQNIIDSINPPPLLSDTDYDEFVDLAGDMLCQMVTSDPMIFAHPTFSDVLYHDTVELLTCQLQPLFDFEIDEYIESATDEAIAMFHTFICPRRSYPTTFIRRKPNIEKTSSTIEYLRNVPQPDQRTEEWYLFRHKYLTASNLWKAFGTQRAQNELIYDKCQPINLEKYKSVNIESPMHWGQKYEDVSIEWYQKKYNTRVSDFGCIPHRNIEYLAASPDGINTEETSDIFGRMLEVKNIVNREINGIPKLEYWIQMQLQMEVCELNECDFLETRFIEYEDEESFNADGSFNATEDGKPKGIILFFNKDGGPLYEYLPFGSTEQEYFEWEEKTMEKHEGLTWVKKIFWKLDEVSCVLVLRNKTWFDSALLVLDKLWETITHERVNGFEHRAPTRKNKIQPITEIKPISECLIDVKNLISNEVNEAIVEDTLETGNDNDISQLSPTIINIKT